MTQILAMDADVMFVNGIASMVSVSRGLKFITVECMPHWTDPVLSQSLENIYKLYSKRGFNVEIFLMDREFEGPAGDHDRDIGPEHNRRSQTRNRN